MQNIFYHGNKKKQIPLNHLDGFFNCVSVLMSAQLRSLALESIQDYVEVFCPDVTKSPLGVFRGFQLNVVVLNSSMEFEPNLQLFEVSALVRCSVKSCKRYLPVRSAWCVGQNVRRG